MKTSFMMLFQVSVTVVTLWLTSFSVRASEVVVGAGATFPERVYAKATELYNIDHESDTNNVVVSYTGMGSSSGRCRLEDWAVKCSSDDTTEPISIDFAGTDSIASESEYEQYPDLQLYPVLAGAVVPIVNIPGALTTESVHFSKDALAKIFRGEITWWNDTRILETQDTHMIELMAENRIVVVVRDGKSGTTEILKSALAQFDPTFDNTTGVSGSTTWVGLSPVSSPDVITTVLDTSFSIGYSVLGDAIEHKVPIADISLSGTNIVANHDSIAAALNEKGSQFGNNGDDPAHLTATVSGALGFDAWPIVGYTYLAMRKDTVRAGSDCVNRLNTVTYWNWFLTSTFVEEIARVESLVTLQGAALTSVVDHFRGDIHCEGERVYHKIIHIQAPAFMDYTLSNVILPQYRDNDPDVSVQIEVREAHTELNVGESLVMMPAAEYVEDFEHSAADIKEMLYAEMALVAIYNLCDFADTTYCDAEVVHMNHFHIEDILKGNVKNWNHSSLVALNGWLSTADIDMSVHITKPNETGMVELLDLLGLEEEDIDASSFTIHSSDEDCRAAVLLNPFSFGITTLFGSVLNGALSIVEMENDEGTAMLPTRDHLLACTDGRPLECYPLHFEMSLLLPSTFSSAAEDDTAHAVLKFTRWLLDREDFVTFSGGVSLVSEAESKALMGEVTADGVSILMGSNEDEFLDTSLANLGMSVALLLLVGQAMLAGGVAFFRKTKVVKNAQPEFMLLLLLGLSIMVCSIFPMSFDDRDEFDGDYDEDSPKLDSYCMMQVWLYFIGYGIAVSALLVKTYRIMAIFNLNSKTIRRKLLTAWDVMPIFIVVVGMVAVLLVGFQIYSPLHFDRTVTAYDSLGYPDASAGTCTTDKPLVFLYVLLVFQTATYLCGNYMASKTKDVNPKFAESKYITMTMSSGLQTSVLTLPVVFINHDDVNTLYIGKLMNVSLQVLALSVFLFAPKCFTLYDEFISSGKIAMTASSECRDGVSSLPPVESEIKDSAFKVIGQRVDYSTAVDSSTGVDASLSLRGNGNYTVVTGAIEEC